MSIYILFFFTETHLLYLCETVFFLLFNNSTCWARLSAGPVLKGWSSGTIHLACISILVKEPSSFTWNWCTVAVTIKGTNHHILGKGPHHVSSWSVSGHSICTFHSSHCTLCPSDSKNSAAFPNYLCKVACSTREGGAGKIVSRRTDLVVPGKQWD